MKAIFDFLRDNYQIIIVLAISLANLFVCLFRKKVKVVDNIYQFILDNLPFYIVTAERLYSLGTDKKSFVISSITNLLTEKFGIKAESYVPFISDSIENILSTPEKKEVLK